ncbi:unnamed protein product [Rotaria socialis]|uniref:DUF7164 domain-containing protein n=3 Tax=Rotaria socialis TaxID=392032 RepID=A0A820QS89_9BILA|nr:unnamed protein product [Rotaria socialis]CAF4427378.1 unnamed protein product [Rotaria socialis]
MILLHSKQIVYAFSIILIIIVAYNFGYYNAEIKYAFHTISTASRIQISPSVVVLSTAAPILKPEQTNAEVIAEPSTIKSSKQKPTVVHLAVVLSLSKQTSHIAEFYLLYESWRFLHNFSPLSQQIVVDLIVFCEQPSCHQLPSACIPLSYKKKVDMIATCFHEILDEKIVQKWNDYLYMTSIEFMLTKEYRKATADYDWILRVDQDAILSPGLLIGLARKHPRKLYPMQFGGIGHGITFTKNRLRNIAKKLGYNHAGIHDLCSTWLVNPKDSVKIANLTTIIGRHILKNEFGAHVPGIESLPAIGEWPKWWRGVTSLYAAEIAINHIYSSTLGQQHESPAIDTPSFAESSIWNAWHIHCLHNEDYFSKFKHRDELHKFVGSKQTDRMQQILNVTSRDKILFETLREFETIKVNYNINESKVSVRDYVIALAWKKSYSATAAINLD